MTIPFALVTAGVIGAHGVGHVLGWLPAWGLARFDQVSTASWALDPLIGPRASQAVAGALYLAPTLGFLVTAAALATGQPWWKEAAVASSMASLVASALYPSALPLSSLVGSTAVNLAVLGFVLWGRPVLEHLVRV